MTEKSLTSLVKSGIVKRANFHKVNYKNVRIQYDFNARDENEEFHEKLHELALLIASGSLQLPPLELKSFGDGSDDLRIIDGHRRYMAHGLILKYPEIYGEHPQLDGGELFLDFQWSNTKTRAEELARVVQTQDNEKLAAMELGAQYRKIRDQGATMDEIATLCGKSKAHVEQHLKFDEAPPEFKEFVASGKVSAAIATEVLRQHGDKALEVLQQEHSEAQAQGKGRITKGTMAASAAKKATPKPPRSILEEMGQHYAELSKSLTIEDRTTLTSYQKGTIVEGRVSVDVGRLLALELAYEEWLRMQSDCDKRERERKDKEKQTDIPV